MTQNTKEYICNNLKWPITNLDYLSKYFILIAPITLIYVAITEYYRNNPALIIFLTGIVLFAIIIYGIETERKFIEIILTKDLSTSEIAKKLTQNKWTFIKQENEVLEFSTKTSLVSWGEKVTIIKVSKDKLLVNSQPSGRNIFSFKNRVNYNTIKSTIE
jgi:hypothetical protein